MEYQVGRERFKTKTALRDKIRSVLYSYDLEQDLSRTDFEFIGHILSMHSSADIKSGCGVNSMFVRENPVYKNRGFWIRRHDGTETDFSFMECLKPSTPKQKFMAACRVAVRSEIIMFRIANLEEDSVCPITGEHLTLSNTHVDHIPPDTFENIVNDFIAKHAIDIDTVKFTGVVDGLIGEEFGNPELSEMFKRYHDQNAKLRLVSAKANLSNIKING